MSPSAKTGFNESHQDYESAGFLEATSTDTMVAFDDFIEILNDDEANEPTTEAYPRNSVPYHSMAREFPHPPRTAELKDFDPGAVLFMDESYGPLNNDDGYFYLTNIVSCWNANDELPINGQGVLSDIPLTEATASSATFQPLSDKGQVLTAQYIDRVPSTSAPLGAVDHAIKDNFAFEREQDQYSIGPLTRVWQVPKLVCAQKVVIFNDRNAYYHDRAREDSRFVIVHLRTKATRRVPSPNKSTENEDVVLMRNVGRTIRVLQSLRAVGANGAN
jgi:hypothetical protein